MITIKLDKISSLRVQLTCQRFLRLKREETEISLNDFCKYYREAYSMKLPNVGRKTVAETAFIICYALTGDIRTKEELIASCAEMLSHPANENDCWKCKEWDLWKYAEEAANTFERITEITLD